MPVVLFSHLSKSTRMIAVPEKDPHTWLALWMSIPDSVKALGINLVMGALMTIRSREKTFVSGCIEVAAGGLLAFVAGYAAQDLFGATGGTLYAINGAVAVLGVDRCKAIIVSLVDNKLFGGNKQ